MTDKKRRACAIRRGRPLTLQPTIELPTVSEDPNDKLALQLDGFVILADLFKSYDDAFVNTWKKAQANLAAPHISRLQKQLDELVPSYLCQDSTFADPHANQQWLKNTVWQLTNRAADDSMSLQYTARISRDLLVSMAGQFPGQGMELLNSGLVRPSLCEIIILPIQANIFSDREAFGDYSLHHRVPLHAARYSAAFYCGPP